MKYIEHRFGPTETIDAIIHLKNMHDVTYAEALDCNAWYNVLNEAKVPVAERPLLPLLACGSQVLWLWGAGFADGLSPDDGTKQILLIRQSRQPAAPEQEQDHNIGGTDHA